MSDLDTRFHETWLGMVQPVEGLVVPVLVEAQCVHRQAPSFQQTLLDACPPAHAPPASAPHDAPVGPRRIGELGAFLEAVLGWSPELSDAGDALPEDLSLYVPEGQQPLRPTLGLAPRRSGRPSRGVVRPMATGANSPWRAVIFG